MTPLRILHTSDWHLGRMLHGRQRHDEFAAFLHWLHEAACAERADILLSAGDIFDTATPGTRSQQLYYDFLCRMAASPCRHIVITAGNHDSPSFLNAPKDLLRRFDIHVIGGKAAAPADEALLLRDQHGEAQAVVCAVPYLRERDLRSSAPGQRIEEREHELSDGVRRHYAEVCAAAEALRLNLPRPVPIIGMGHLFAAGCAAQEGKGEEGGRSLHVGSLACIEADAFPSAFDYVALGHLHSPQKVGGSETRRYSGAPLAMSFADAEQRKSVCLVAFMADGPQVRLLPVPVFQQIRSVRGSWPEIAAALARLKEERRSIWLEVVHQGEELVSGLRERLDELTAGSELELLLVRNIAAGGQSLSPQEEGEALTELRHEQVFARCLEERKIPAEQRPGLLAAYQEVVSELLEADLLAVR